MLKASLKQIPILEGYLHDSYFKPDAITFDPDKRCFAMDVERVYYEGAERGKVLWFIPVVRYPWIQSHLTMTGISQMDQKWHDRGVDGPDDKQLLMGIAQKSDDTIELGSTHFRITLSVTSDFELILLDEPEPEKGPRVTDFSKGIFYGMDEIDELRVDAQPENGTRLR